MFGFLFFALPVSLIFPNTARGGWFFWHSHVWPSAGQHNTWSRDNRKLLTDFEDLLSQLWGPTHHRSLCFKGIHAKKYDNPRDIKSTHTCSKATPNSLTWVLIQTFLCLGQYLSGSGMAKKIIIDNSKQLSAGKSFLKVLGWGPKALLRQGLCTVPREGAQLISRPSRIIPFWVWK